MCIYYIIYSIYSNIYSNNQYIVITIYKQLFMNWPETTNYGLSVTDIKQKFVCYN